MCATPLQNHMHSNIISFAPLIPFVDSSQRAVKSKLLTTGERLSGKIFHSLGDKQMAKAIYFPNTSSKKQQSSAYEAWLEAVGTFLLFKATIFNF